MNNECSHCGQAFELEPGFYWGSMYVAYALSSGFLLFGFAFVFFMFQTSIIKTFFIVFGILALLYGLVFRVSRAIWINLFVHYDPKADKQPKLYKDERS